MERLVHLVAKYDLRVFYTCHQEFRCKLFDLILPKITHLGGAVFSLSLLFLMLLYPGLVETRWVLSALGALSASHLTVHFIKKKFTRARPYDRLEDVRLSSKALKDFSFPSGHSAAAFSLAVMFSLYAPVLSFMLLPAAAVVAFSRMYLGLHYPTDCIIGAAIGSVSSLLVAFTVLGL